MAELIRELGGNQIFNGMAAGSVLAFLLYLVREAPAKLLEVFLWRFTSCVTLHNDDQAFDRFAEWLANLGYTQTAKRLRLTTNHEDDECATLVTPGVGNHLIRVPGLWFMLEREERDNEHGIFTKETIHLRCLGRPERLRAVIEEALSNGMAGGQATPVFLFRTYWRRVAKKKWRDVETVVLEPGLKREIIRDLEEFVSKREWYEDKGIPYRRGHLYRGRPGTGKTSFALVVAGFLKKPLYTLNLGSLSDDNALFDAVLSVPGEAILLIEDIDAANASATRVRSGTPPPKPKDDEKKGITLSGLLNCLDGAFTRDGRILIMTTNHPEEVDPAVFRSGRIDAAFDFEWFHYPEAITMVRRFIPDPEEAHAFISDEDFPVEPAALQERLKRWSNGETRDERLHRIVI